MLTVDQLRSPMKAKEFLALHLAALGSLGFHVGSWAVGAIQRTFLTSYARIGSDQTELSRTFVEFSLNDYSSGDPLGELSSNVFDNEPSPARYAQGPMTLTNSGTTPHTIRPGSVVARTVTGVQFISVDWDDGDPSKTLAPGGTLSVNMRAVIAGASGNIPSGTPLSLVSSLAGVTIDNGVAGGEPWYTTTGADPETTPSLRTRNRTKWATLALDMIGDGYRNLALTIPGIEKVAINDLNPRGENTIDVYVAGAASLVGDTEKNQLQLLFSRRVWGSVPTIDDANFADSTVQVLDPPVQVLQLNGTVFHSSGYTSADIRTAVETALDKYLLALNMGGKDLSPGPSNVIPVGDLFEVIEHVRGVRTLQLDSPTGSFIEVGSLALVLKASAYNLVYTPTVSS
ncbi:MAG: baseplate J/gp47 family protein [Gammaproteobacteria bacterium]|nr:baseplate J/gp47 family protein [Gammaproteobacteria bacterium]